MFFLHNMSKKEIVLSRFYLILSKHQLITNYLLNFKILIINSFFLFNTVLYSGLPFSKLIKYFNFTAFRY